ncbi:hypothetical protein [Prosthecobacter sp.]|uniref:hypothetical protein n=1 Tax=Prosthecobacter sp. TaxID=1965333 RepID=UPI003783E547
MHGLKYQLLAFLTTAFLLLVSRVSCHAGLRADSPVSGASLSFTIEQHPGKADWISGTLNSDGDFRLLEGHQGPRSGSLPAQESLRILEAYGKLCERAGADHFPPEPVFFPFGRGGGAFPSFTYVSPQGRRLELMDPRHPLPPEFTAFLRILWQKLLTHHDRQKLLDSLIPPLPR